MLEMKVKVLQEPSLEFGGTTEAMDPKEGLTAGGPFSLRYNPPHPSAVKLGMVGNNEMIDKASEWFAKCKNGILTEKGNRRRHPDFPSFEEIFRTPLEMEDRWITEVRDRDLGQVLSRPEGQRFEALLDLYEEQIARTAERELGPNVIICSLPQDLLGKYRTSNQVTTRGRSRRKGVVNKGQYQLAMFPGEDSGEETGTDGDTSRDFRRALKAKAMLYKLPTQLANDHLFLSPPGSDDPATKAWDVCTACFYKAGGIPWRLANSDPHVCYAGISFHRLKTSDRNIVYSSTAQAFSTDIEGFVLKGEQIDWDRADGRIPHLNQQQALNLGKEILAEYRSRSGRDPLRIALHKTSKFSDGEKEGFAEAWRTVPQREFIVLYQTSFRLLSEGDYPPRRGTKVEINGTNYLYTTGFYEPWGSYPGPHVPSPMEIRIESQGGNIERSCNEILALTKMNFNSATPSEWGPITTRMAREVGLILGEIEEGRTLETSYRYYM